MRKKTLTMLAVLLMMGTADVNAQGVLKKLKQKAENAITKVAGVNTNEREDEDEDDSEGAVAVPKGSDIIQKRKQTTLIWNGVVKPSTATTSQALLAELPPLPSAEKMARSTQEERDAYYMKILAVTERATQLEENATGCSDAETEAERKKWENKICDQFGITQKELEILGDDNISESQKEPIRQKMMTKILGVDMNDSEMEKFEKMSEKEQEAYIKAHPEFVAKMQKAATNAMDFGQKMQQMASGAVTLETRMAKLAQDMQKFAERESAHDYSALGAKYNSKLEKIYKQIFATDDMSQVDALYAEADELLYNYRLEAAKEYRASLARQIEKEKTYLAEYNSIMSDAVKDGTLPECALERADFNMVISIANILEDAYKDIPELDASPVEKKVLYTLPKGYGFAISENRCYVGFPSGGVDAAANAGRGGGPVCWLLEKWPMLVSKDSKDGVLSYGVLNCDGVKDITEAELVAFNKKASYKNMKDQRKKEKPAYGKYKSRSGKRTVEYAEDGYLVIEGMSYFDPVSFSAQEDKLQWVEIDGNQIVLCTYKL
ncbi:MAG: hypothetical protein J5790_02690 [Bacteroidaceae bacterium]|nr:hypothetical protein [Bacteroidaceae bacterium]